METETHLGYGGLFDVLSPLLDGAFGSAAPGARRCAAGRAADRGGRVVDPFAVAVASLDLLAMAAEDAPVLVVVDDAPWVDAASLEALRFAARRLDADRVGFLFAARSELAAPFVDAGFESLTVGGLDTREAVGLVHEFAGSPVEESVARVLASAGGGHPLWLREAARELSPEQTDGRRAADGPLSRAGGRAGGVRAAGAESLRAGPLCARGVERRRAGAGAGDANGRWPISGSPRSAIQPGIDCGLAHLEAGRPRFSHPLAQAAAIEVAAPAQRRLAHEALARAWSEAGEPERAAWHLAEAGDGPDAHVSSALAGVARAARARGAPAAAAEAWRRAVETAPDADQALRLRLERARDLAQAGRASDALVELDEILDRGRAAELRADAEILQGQLLISQGRLEQAARGATKRVLRGSGTAIRRARR